MSTNIKYPYETITEFTLHLLVSCDLTFVLRVVCDVALTKQHILPAILDTEVVGYLLPYLRVDVAQRYLSNNNKCLRNGR